MEVDEELMKDREPEEIAAEKAMAAIKEGGANVEPLRTSREEPWSQRQR